MKYRHCTPEERQQHHTNSFNTLVGVITTENNCKIYVERLTPRLPTENESRYLFVSDCVIRLKNGMKAKKFVAENLGYMKVFMGLIDSVEKEVSYA